MFGRQKGEGPQSSLKNTTLRRKRVTTIAEFCTLVSIVFSILVLIGNIRDVRILNDMYFLRIDVSNVIPRSIPNAVLVNSIAQSLGLRDFYQVGLWNYCEGYNGQGVTYCSPPKAMYSFNPVEILLSQLLDGATIAMPATITDALAIVKMASHWMFASYIIGICLAVITLSIGWIDIFTRWNSLVTGLISLSSALFTTIAAAISTALFVVFQKVFEDQPDFNIHGDLGTHMFIFMWMASAFAILTFTLHAAMCCCTTSQRRAKKITGQATEEHSTATSTSEEIAEKRAIERGSSSARKND
ncbi:hypothetical protein P167DRAFT_540652 [Morchella conica CCBAS932]|uniref:Integral membrane protein n=1 Tax=Morchella conica CCBAS932 TaxID=1392247 RepID=A0A3N4KE41_9PEZI|nr:hypothetical protein P167DRAFT_540652 [Morchella conica CCBAS932]